MTEFLLVHSPMLGPGSCSALAAGLRAAGHAVQVPDLRGTLATGPGHWERQAASAAGVAGDGPVLLVGHSGAGPLLPVIGKELRRAAGYVFIDAGLPCPGRSRREQAPPAFAAQILPLARNGWLPPWPYWWGADALAAMLPDPVARERFVADCPRPPVQLFEEPAPPVDGWPDAPCAYLRLSEGYAAQEARARELGWPSSRIPGQHLSVLTAPEPVLEALLGLVARLQGDHAAHPMSDGQ